MNNIKIEENDELDQIWDLLDSSEHKGLALELKERLKDLYTHFNRPMTGELLRILNLDILYTKGTGNYLFYINEKNIETKVLDLVGGYGANILGHKNKVITNHLIDYLKDGPSNLVQGSLKKYSTNLAQKLSQLLNNETGINHWVTTLTNSGAETIEAALKLCLMDHFLKKQNLQIINNVNQNKVNLCKHDTINKLLNLINQTLGLNFSSLEEVIKHNQSILESTPKIIAFEGAFHGKTLGALFLTSKEDYRIPFQLDNISNLVIRIPLNDRESVTNEILRNNNQFIRINDNLTIDLINFNHIAGCFIEPIQGEAGIIECEKIFLTELKQLLVSHKILLVSDEIQTGLYRTDSFCALSHFNIFADIYCFSKGLGGGVQKIGAMCAAKSIYPHEFGYLHTSTFAEDEQSSFIACKVLDILAQDLNQLKKFNLKSRLSNWQKKNEKYIKPIKGLGFILGIEFTEELASLCLELKIFDNSGLLGYIIASAILHNSNVRVLPSLSSKRTLRVQPSLYFSETEYTEFEAALNQLIVAIEKKDMNYFFGHLYPNEKIHPGTAIKQGEITGKKAKHPLAVFFCHMINPEHAKDLVPAFKDINPKIWSKKLSKVAKVLKFSEMYRTTLYSKEKKPIEVIMMGNAISSKMIVDEIKNGNTDRLVALLQEGIDFVKEEYNATTIGLGQFTSIISKNGLKLDSRGLNITTGNAYTTGLCVDATIDKMKEINLSKYSCNIGFVGMAGNIVSITAIFLSEYCKKMTMIYHTDLNQSIKFQNVLIDFFNEIFSSSSDSLFTVAVKTFMTKKISSVIELEQLTHKLIEKDHLVISTDLESLGVCDIIVSGTSSPKPFISCAQLKSNAIIVDIGVPNNIILETLDKRPDLHYLQGGIASLPLNPFSGDIQSINTQAFPLELGTSYACLAETIAITMNDCSHINHIGDLSKKMVIDAKNYAMKAGITLHGIKKSKSF